ncbi:hypothetical protein [uncultured Paraglaciecola sp.]|uniref:hypothetical protein n=1 Tax=uncultured Paraglaciecola sp. TaxID=1765024 RepID=UPI002627DB18|nr:hypothetical protein [uncultured Paraglaciecola sp.]
MLNYFTLVALDMFIPIKLLSSDVQNIHIDNTKKCTSSCTIDCDLQLIKGNQQVSPDALEETNFGVGLFRLSRLMLLLNTTNNYTKQFLPSNKKYKILKKVN